MEYIIIAIGIIAFLIGIILFIKGRKHLHLLYSSIEQEYTELLNKQFSDRVQQLNELNIQVEETRAAASRTIESEKNRIDSELQTLRQARKKMQDLELEQEYEKKKSQYELEYNTKVEELTNLYDEYRTNIYAAKEDLDAQIADKNIELQQFQKSITAIQERLRAEQELKNLVDSRRIILSDNAKDDIHYLLSIEDNIHNKEILHKLLWSEYIQRPFVMMLKNSLGNKSPKNVIYCIENIDTT